MHEEDTDTETGTETGTETEEEDDYDAAYDEEEIIRCKWIGDGSNTLDDLITRLEGFADYVRFLKSEGWELARTMDDDYGFMRQNAEGKARAEAAKTAKAAAAAEAEAAKTAVEESVTST